MPGLYLSIGSPSSPMIPTYRGHMLSESKIAFPLNPRFSHPGGAFFVLTGDDEIAKHTSAKLALRATSLIVKTDIFRQRQCMLKTTTTPGGSGRPISVVEISDRSVMAPSHSGRIVSID